MYGEFLRYEGYSTLILYMLLFLAARKASLSSLKHFPYVLLSASGVALYGIFQHYGLDPFPRDIIRMGWQVAFSTMGNQNFLGTFLVLMLPLSLHYFLTQKKWLGLVSYGILFYCLLASRTNSALVGIVLALAAYFLLVRLWRLKGLFIKNRLLSVIGLSLCLLVLFNLQTGNSTFFEIKQMKMDLDAMMQKSEGYEHAGSNRMFIWVRVLELVKARPLFGYGIENLGHVMEREYHQDIIDFWGTTAYVDKTHNEYLHTAFSAGVPALLAYLIFIGLVLKQGLKSAKVRPDLLPIFAAIVGYLGQAFFNISVVCVAYVFWIFLGLISQTTLSQTKK